MAEIEPYGGFGLRLDIRQTQLEAQSRWLRPAEICEILQNYQLFRLSSEPPYRPPSGSLLLFDRRVLRFFRKDGHNWSKKKDGKMVKEGHEKLKVGSVDVLHCYYAHGQENENFQRRCYWLLEQAYMHVVLVHYLEVKGNRSTTVGIKAMENVASQFQKGSSFCFFSPSTSVNTDSPSPTSTLTSVCEDAEYEDSHQVISRLCSSLELQQTENNFVNGKMYADLGSYNLHSHSDHERRQTLEHCKMGFGALSSGVPNTSTPPTGVTIEQERATLTQSLEEHNYSEKLRSIPPIQTSWQVLYEENSLHLPEWRVDQKENLDSRCDSEARFLEPCCLCLGGNPVKKDPQIQPSSKEYIIATEASPLDDKLIAKTPFLDAHKNQAGLEKVDSFSRWMTNVLEEVEELKLQSGTSHGTFQGGNGVDDSSQFLLEFHSLIPSISQDHLFSIVDFSPNWSYMESETKVLITGIFLVSKEEVLKCKWSCMFGEIEVPAEVLSDGVLCCCTPPNRAGRVPFYVTCSNRLPCSEVCEFEYLVSSVEDMDSAVTYNSPMQEMLLQLRLEGLLSQRSGGNVDYCDGGVVGERNTFSKSKLSRAEDEKYHSHCAIKEELLEKLMKDKLCAWLLQKVTEDGKGPSLLDDRGQGVLHLCAALGYDWAIQPTIFAGVNINFRDVNGWTALHWAAFCGREHTVAILISLGATPGALTDPSPRFPLGRTPADLASANGHKGISGFLAECSLTTYLSSLTLNDTKEQGPLEQPTGVTRAVQTVSERKATPLGDGGLPYLLSWKDSLAAVCNATLAADRIHQVFRVQSFQRRLLAEYETHGLDEPALALVAIKSSKLRQTDSAATQIQKKLRGWKNRKDYLIIRQKIIKIQAHVRGHQSRKRYRAVIWSVGVLEKVILRWRRKGSGLRGFQNNAIAKGPKAQGPLAVADEDDYDFLKEGRKQTEERYRKALSRVKSMAQHPEGREQYRRLLTAVERYCEPKVAWNVIPNGFKESIDIETFLDDDNFMSSI